MEQIGIRVTEKKEQVTRRGGLDILSTGGKKKKVGVPTTFGANTSAKPGGERRHRTPSVFSLPSISIGFTIFQNIGGMSRKLKNDRKNKTIAPGIGAGFRNVPAVAWAGRMTGCALRGRPQLS